MGHRSLAQPALTRAASPAAREGHGRHVIRIAFGPTVERQAVDEERLVNESNRGFPAAANQGMGQQSGEAFCGATTSS